MVTIGVIGFGYWGPNIVRNFLPIENVEVVAICDLSKSALMRAKKGYPALKTVSNPNDILTSKEIDAVAIVTPVYTHFELAKKALENGKHLFIEKPFTSNVSEAETLIELAEKKNLIIMVDHTFLFTSAVKKIKELTDNNILGELYYYDSTRVNLGLFQHDINVVWDLAPHDFSIMDYVIKEKPTALLTTGAKHFGTDLEDVAYVTVFFDNNLIAHFNVNWLSPVKIRSTIIGGEKKMLLWNDLEADEKIKIYDKGVNVESQEGLHNLLVEYRSGDIQVPRIDHIEALKIEVEYFVNCILNNEIPFNDGYAGLRIVRMLEATDKSLKDNGKMINI